MSHFECFLHKSLPMSIELAISVITMRLGCQNPLKDAPPVSDHVWSQWWMDGAARGETIACLSWWLDNWLILLWGHSRLFPIACANACRNPPSAGPIRMQELSLVFIVAADIWSTTSPIITQDSMNRELYSHPSFSGYQWFCVPCMHDDVIKWKYFPRYWYFVRRIHRSPIDSPHKGQCRRAYIFSLICARTNGWADSRDASDLRRHRAHYGDILMGSNDIIPNSHWGLIRSLATLSSDISCGCLFCTHAQFGHGLDRHLQITWDMRHELTHSLDNNTGCPQRGITCWEWPTVKSTVADMLSLFFSKSWWQHAWEWFGHCWLLVKGMVTSGFPSHRTSNVDLSCFLWC